MMGQEVEEVMSFQNHDNRTAEIGSVFGCQSVWGTCYIEIEIQLHLCRVSKRPNFLGLED
jgi:hypothetical protein